MVTKKAAVKKTAAQIGGKLIETREQKLQRLASARIRQVNNKIRLIGNLAAYKPTPEQVDKLMFAIGQMCSRVEDRLRAAKQEVPEFTL